MMNLIVVISIIAILAIALLRYLWQRYRIKRLEKEYKNYTGGCHCGKVSFVVTAPKHLVSWVCNCSICDMKKNYHFIVPAKNFQLSKSSIPFLTEYKFNKQIARHMFCKICGVQSYYQPRSNPDGYAITLACIKKEEIESSEMKHFDGINWEKYIFKSKIQKFSKAD